MSVVAARVAPVKPDRVAQHHTLWWMSSHSGERENTRNNAGNRISLTTTASGEWSSDERPVLDSNARQARSDVACQTSPPDSELRLAYDT